MRGLFSTLFSRPRRNENVRLEDPHPIPNYGDHDYHSGDPFHDGYTRLSRADPDRAGTPPPVAGTLGVIPRGPDDSFEQ